MVSNEQIRVTKFLTVKYFQNQHNPISIFTKYERTFSTKIFFGKSSSVATGKVLVAEASHAIKSA